MKLIKIDENNTNKRLDIFFSDFSGKKYTRSKITIFINEGFILVNNIKQKPSYRLKYNDEVTFDSDKAESFFKDAGILKPFKYNLDIRYEDEYLIVVNKPKNMLTHPTVHEKDNTLVNALLYHCKKLSDIGENLRPGIVHRLDKNTSGLMVAAKDNQAHLNLAEQIRNKIANRKYLAIALGEFKEQEGVIDKSLVHYLKDNVKMTIAPDNEGLEAITLYRVIKQFKGAALVELELKTGRTHQIRAHLSSINHPVFGDDLYGAKQFLKKEFNNLKTQGQLLQSYYLSFYHPITKEKMEFTLEENAFSDDFIKVLNFLRRNNEY